MLAEIISIGDELLSGSTINTNAAFIGDQLTHAGIEVGWVTAVGDHDDRLQDTLRTAVGRAGILILTGGLGPTHDDITKVVVSGFFKRPLLFHPDIYQKLEEYFKSRGRVLSASNRVQAEIPEGAVVLSNPIGTAPGLYLIHEQVHCFLMPGVPMEMRRMLQEQVIPRLKLLGFSRFYLSKTIHTIGIPESTLNQNFRTFGSQFPDIRLASLPDQQGVSLRLSLQTEDSEKGHILLNQAAEFTRFTAGRYVFGEDEETLESVVGESLKNRGWTLAVAESCTGGLISDRLTNVPGSSDYFKQGVIAYSNASKTALLNVPGTLISRYGAVSAETAMSMAEGIRETSGSDVGLSVTGIAGPSGGSDEKPVGLVFIGYADARQTLSEKYIFSNDRLMNKLRSAGYALDLVRRHLQDNP